MAAGWLTTIPEQEAFPPEGSLGFNHPPMCGRLARAAAGGQSAAPSRHGRAALARRLDSVEANSAMSDLSSHVLRRLMRDTPPPIDLRQ